MSAPKVRPVRFVVTLLVGALLVALLVWPQAFGLQRVVFFTQVVAFRSASAIALGIGAVLFAAIALRTKGWGVAAGLAIVLGIAGAASGGILIARGSTATVAAGELTVVAWNTQGGAASPTSVARLIMDADADIVSLPETDEYFADETVRLLSAQGHAMSAHTAHGLTGYSEIPTSVLIAERIGQYRMDDSAGSTPALPSAVWRPVDGAGPTIVGAHPLPPLPQRMGTWRTGLEWVADQCDAPEVIVAGDLNATLDHMSGLSAGGGLIGACDDAALAAGAGAVGTWPTTAPPWLATPIDHVLVGSAWTVRGARVVTSLDDAGSDHRPIVVTLDAR